MKVVLSVVVTLLSVGGGVLADEPFRIGLPVNCAFGSVCSIQNFVDLDPGSGRLDPGCGRLSYDGHDGTDIRVRDLVAMREGVTVLAAAGGVVKATRDGMPDVSIRDAAHADVAGREAGNGVLIEHGGGWETQYSHLRSGTVSVKPGDQVEAGAPLGMIGLSGQTEFPHVHFTVRKDGIAVDPFTGSAGAWACGSPKLPLWADDAARILTYVPTGVLIAGFSSSRPNAEAIRRGDQRLGKTVRDPPALVLWADMFGTHEGDIQSFAIAGPDGSVILENHHVLEEDNVSYFAFGGRNRPPGGWTPGVHTGTFTLLRGGETITTRQVEVIIDR